MNTEHNSIDYGIYIDGKSAFVISLSSVFHELIIDEEEVVNNGILPRRTKVAGQEQHFQNNRNEQLKKFCKSIILTLTDAHRILIFGPSESKYELQNEIQANKRLENVKEELLVTDFMEKEEAVRFVQSHFTVIAAGHQVFIAPGKNKAK